MKVEAKKFSKLSIKELYELLKLRTEIFVVEQECIYQDMDGKDNKAIHILGKEEDKIVAYTRIFNSGGYYDEPSIGRVVVRNSNRGENKGKEIMKESINYIKNNMQEKEIVLSAQKYLDKFYTDLGFKSEGEDYLEDGIPHQKMRLVIE